MLRLSISRWILRARAGDVTNAVRVRFVNVSFMRLALKERHSLAASSMNIESSGVSPLLLASAPRPLVTQGDCCEFETGTIPFRRAHGHTLNATRLLDGIELEERLGAGRVKRRGRAGKARQNRTTSALPPGASILSFRKSKFLE